MNDSTVRIQLDDLSKATAEKLKPENILRDAQPPFISDLDLMSPQATVRKELDQAREIIAKIAMRLNVSVPAQPIENHSAAAAWAALGEAIIEKIDQDWAERP